MKIFLTKEMTNNSRSIKIMNPHPPVRLIARKNKNNQTFANNPNEIKESKPLATFVFQPIILSKDPGKCSPPFLAPFLRTRANLEWLEPKWTQVRPSKFERLYKHKLFFLVSMSLKASFFLSLKRQSWTTSKTPIQKT